MPCSCLYGVVYVPEGLVHMHPHTILKGRVNAKILKMQTHSKLICGVVDTSGEPPIAENLAIDVLEDETADIELGGSSPGNLALSYTVTSQPINGALTGTSPDLVYTPNANYAGQDSFIYKVSDANGESEDATVSITINAVNDTPVSENITKSLDEDTPMPITLRAFDQDGDVLTYEIVAQPSKGALSGELPNLIYTPNANANGPDNFTYRVTDGTNVSNVATVSLDIIAVNDAPVAAAISQSVAEDGSVVFAVQVTDVEGDALTYDITKQPQFGTATLENGAITYTPNANYHGADTIEYTAQDEDSTSNIAEITLTVTPENDAPTATPLTLAATEDTPLNLVLGGIDIDGDTLTYQVTTQPEHGTLTGTAPNLTYTPSADYHGADSITFRVNDGMVDSAVATVSLTVNLVNDHPVAQNLSLETDEDNAFVFQLTGTDVDGDTLTYSVVTQPTHGILSGTAPNLTYTPSENYNGVDSFTYKVNDGTVDSGVATVSITVSPVNDDPEAIAQSVTANEDAALPIVLSATDIDGDTLNYAVVTQPAHGSLSGAAPNLIYTPSTDYNGADSFTFKANDGTVDSGIATVAILDNTQP